MAQEDNDQAATLEFKVFEGENQLCSVRISLLLIRIGRQDNAHLKIDDDGVENLHALIECVGDVAVLRDTGTPNGTLLNGKMVYSTTLHDGDIIQVGKKRIVVKVIATREQKRQAAMN